MAGLAAAQRTPAGRRESIGSPRCCSSWRVRSSMCACCADIAVRVVCRPSSVASSRVSMGARPPPARRHRGGGHRWSRGPRRRRDGRIEAVSSETSCSPRRGGSGGSSPGGSAMRSTAARRCSSVTTWSGLLMTTTWSPSWLTAIRKPLVLAARRSCRRQVAKSRRSTGPRRTTIAPMA